MKKYLLSIAVALMAALSFTACSSNNEDEPIIEGKYVFYEPIMKWNSSMADVRSQMKAKSGWQENVEDEDPDQLIYTNASTLAQIFYSFDKDGLKDCEVMYWECNDKFEQMKSDWAKALNITWKEDSAFGHVFWEAHSAEKQCKLNAQQGHVVFDYMIVTITRELEK